MQDRPTTAELIEAVRDYLTRELLPTVGDHRLRFRGLVAANILAITARELAAGEADLLAEWAELAPLLGLPADPPDRLVDLQAAVERGNRELCTRIRAGEFDADPRREAALRFARGAVERKLRVNNPRYLERFYATPVPRDGGGPVAGSDTAVQPGGCRMPPGQTPKGGGA